MEILERESERREKEKKERGEGRGKKEFRPSLLLFPLSPHERRYKRRNTSCLVNITGYRPCLGDRNVGQRRAPSPCVYIDREDRRRDSVRSRRMNFVCPRQMVNSEPGVEA